MSKKEESKKGAKRKKRERSPSPDTEKKKKRHKRKGRKKLTLEDLKEEIEKMRRDTNDMNRRMNQFGNVLGEVYKVALRSDLLARVRAAPIPLDGCTRFERRIFRYDGLQNQIGWQAVKDLDRNQDFVDLRNLLESHEQGRLSGTTTSLEFSLLAECSAGFIVAEATTQQLGFSRFAMTTPRQRKDYATIFKFLQLERQITFTSAVCAYLVTPSAYENEDNFRAFFAELERHYAHALPRIVGLLKTNMFFIIH